MGIWSMQKTDYRWAISRCEGDTSKLVLWNRDLQIEHEQVYSQALFKVKVM